ncbi:MAG: alpha/beta hydrolase [Bacteroidales bacterium]|jgi:pimeloyl-ACP methyl ester carboxylesterase|nr:alpha/beta hydrolase [Bacteroidales bacterium]
MLDNEKPSVIFLHGSGANSQMWSEHIIALQDTFNCIAPDFPGHGTRRGDMWTSLEDVTDSFAEIITSKCGGKAHLVGLSLGGSVIYKILEKYPHLVDKAVIDGASAKPIAGSRFIAMGVKMVAPFIKYDPVIKIMAGALGVPPDGYESFRQSMKSVSPKAFGRAMAQANLADMDIEKCNFTSPTLFISGEKEAEIMHLTHKFLSKKISGSRCYIYPGGSHAWMVKDPQTHIKLVKDWLTLNHGN